MESWPTNKGNQFQSLTRDSNHSNSRSTTRSRCIAWFQSLTRDSNHSNSLRWNRPDNLKGFNPSRGIAIIQTFYAGLQSLRIFICFNPSRGIAIIQTACLRDYVSLNAGFNPSRGIAIIQTAEDVRDVLAVLVSIPHAG